MWIVKIASKKLFLIISWSSACFSNIYNSNFMVKKKGCVCAWQGGGHIIDDLKAFSGNDL